MQLVLCKLTAKRTRNGLETTSKEIIGVCGEDPETHLDRLAQIIGQSFLRDICRVREHSTGTAIVANGADFNGADFTGR